MFMNNFQIFAECVRDGGGAAILALDTSKQSVSQAHMSSSSSGSSTYFFSNWPFAQWPRGAQL